jgi:hypothetical protein
MIDIEKEREWWALNGESVCGTQATEMAGDYLDELEATRRTVDHLQLENRCKDQDVQKLRAQLADQRARDIRMITIQAFGVFGADDVALAETVKAYDRLAAIPVPPPSEVIHG